MNASSKRTRTKYCANCTMPIEYCAFNDKKVYKQCLGSLAKHYPQEAEHVLSTTAAPTISVSKCGISRINGTYKQLSKSQPFTYVHQSRPTLSIIKGHINALSLTNVWIIAEQSSAVHYQFIIHHYINKTVSLYPPVNRWQCIAGIYPLPTVKHMESTSKKKSRKTPPIKISIEHQKANEYLEKQWKPYPKIPNLMETMFITQLNEEGHTKDDVMWVATEKIHGANLSLICDGKYVLSAKRTSVLKATDAFYKGWQFVVDSEKPHIIKCFHHIQQHMDPSVICIIVYGELFGGSFSMNHAKQNRKKKYVQIQKGVNYSPKHHFYPFDILIITKSADNEEDNDDKKNVTGYTEYFLSWDKMIEVFKKCAFEVYATGIMEGNLQQLIREFDPNTFISTIPHKLGLEKPTKDNIAEGVVMRKKNGERICVKYKADKFGEIDIEMQTKLKRDISLPTSLKDIEQTILEICENDGTVVRFIYQCINENRLNCVASKIGEINKVNYNKIVGHFTSDVWSEINAQHRDKINLISKSDKVIVRKFITECIRQFVLKQIH